MNGNPSKKQDDFHKWCRELGCAVCLDDNPAIHHIKGSKMKLKGCLRPGEWYVIPLCYRHHQGRNGVHANKSGWVEDYGTEKSKWVWVVGQYEAEHREKPMTEEEYLIILERG